MDIEPDLARAQDDQRKRERQQIIEYAEQQQPGQHRFLVELPQGHQHGGVEDAEPAGGVTGKAEQRRGDEDHRRRIGPLRQMARVYPSSNAEFARVSGVGQRKLDEFGKVFLAEIAAHLGEVLWVRGDKEEAREIWRGSLKANPGNALLQTVIKKFIP